MKKLIACLLSLVFALSFLTACGGQTVSAADLTANYQPNPPDSINLRPELSAAVTDFSADIFTHSLKHDANTLVSPLSIMYALAMTANGAQGQTLTQLESVFGTDMRQLNHYLYSYRVQSAGSREAKLNIANAIWVRNNSGLSVSEKFLQTNADFYGAGIYSAPFDKTTVKEVNDFARRSTDGMINKIIDDIPADRIMILINAIVFDSRWQDEYKKSQINDAFFTDYTGAQQPVQMMYSEEDIYLLDENAKGFVKYYKGGNFAFAALLPDENVDITEYAAALDGEKLAAVMKNHAKCTVNVGIPEFTADYSAEMKDILAEMGTPLVFDTNRADLSAMGTSDENLYIGTVLHKTFIDVSRKGTKAAAVTMVGADCRGAEIEVPSVILDRPFVYMIVDTQNNIPVFMGTMMTV